MTMPPAGSLADSVAYAAARYRRQVLTLPELRELVDTMMHQEIWYDEFIEVLEPPEGGWENLLPVIERMLGHVGLPMPNASDADLFLIARLLRPIAQGDIDPVTGLHEFMRQYAWECTGTDPSLTSMESVGITGLVGLFYQCDDWLNAPESNSSERASELITLKSAIMSAAALWLSQSAPVQGQSGVSSPAR